jgi:uncharacterized alkaline shock family protein YloU
MNTDTSDAMNEGNTMNDGNSDKSFHKTDRAEVNTTVHLDEDTEVRGTVRIAPAVLIQLIETTVLDIPGIVALTAHKRKMTDESGEVPQGKSFDDGKVRVTVDGDQIDADIAITVQNGTNIGELTGLVREKVGVAAGRMLGMTVRTVDIYVDDIIPLTS